MPEVPGGWDATLDREERAHLVRLCALLTGDGEAAEDLVQETLLEAWRVAARLGDPSGRVVWLSAIARNVCRRWLRRRGRERDHLVLSPPVAEAVAAPLPDELPGDGDVEMDVERGELAALLDRALALLPPLTRTLLVEKYIQEAPQAEIAARRGLSEGAVELRLHRGKQVLRRLLEQDLHAEAAAYGIGSQDASSVQSTRLWCPFCGQQRLRASLDPTDGAVAFRCPACSSLPRENVVSTGQAALVRGVRSHRVILSRQLKALHRTRGDALHTGVGVCLTCGQTGSVHRVAPTRDGHAPRVPAGIYVFCVHCSPATPPLPWFSRAASALCLPATQRFWREHPRMSLLPDRPLTYQGEPAVLTRYRSVASQATLAIISGRDTFDILSVHASAPL